MSVWFRGKRDFLFCVHIPLVYEHLFYKYFVRRSGYKIASLLMDVVILVLLSLTLSPLPTFSFYIKISHCSYIIFIMHIKLFSLIKSLLVIIIWVSQILIFLTNYLLIQWKLGFIILTINFWSTKKSLSSDIGFK